MRMNPQTMTEYMANRTCIWSWYSVLLQEIDTTIDRPCMKYSEPFDWFYMFLKRRPSNGLKKQFTLFVEKRKRIQYQLLFINIGILAVVTDNVMNAGIRMASATMKRLCTNWKFNRFLLNQLHLPWLANVIVFELFKHVADDSYRGKRITILFIKLMKHLKELGILFINNTSCSWWKFYNCTIENLFWKTWSIGMANILQLMYSAFDSLTSRRPVYSIVWDDKIHIITVITNAIVQVAIHYQMGPAPLLLFDSQWINS